MLRPLLLMDRTVNSQVLSAFSAGKSYLACIASLSNDTRAGERQPRPVREFFFKYMNINIKNFNKKHMKINKYL